MAFILTLLLVFIVLVSSEIWWRKQNLHGEFSRKSVHITIGSFVGFWPYFLSPNEIKIFSIAFIVGLAVSKYLNIFQTIHSVQRPTLGEFWFAATVGILAFIIPHQAHVYTAAILVMSLADGLAAVIGTHYGNSRRYLVFGSAKSIAGTATFFVTTCLILFGYAVLTPHALPLAVVGPIALVATIFENVGIRGLDNLLVPLFVAGSLLSMA